MKNIFFTKQFQLFLSHDIDQIYDRELFRVLADVNHGRRLLLKGEAGDLKFLGQRLLRSLLHPKPPVRDFSTILEIEARHGFCSTFFVLDDLYWSRRGGRYGLRDQALRDIAGLIQQAGGEIGVHGAYGALDDSQAYARSRVRIGEALGVEPRGIRNHFLRFSGPKTWQAQVDAGFCYDATFADAGALGNKDQRDFPFWTGALNQRGDELLELPLTIMDTTLFRYLGLRTVDAAVSAAWKVIAPVIERGGLVSLLWHNNFFNEPEYAIWQKTYEVLLARLAEHRPYCATGWEIAQTWARQDAKEFLCIL